MNATTTHDSKRGEDSRARLNVLSELPSEWRNAVSSWMRINRAGRSTAAGTPAPDRGDEYHFYQALLAIWPAELESADVPAQAQANIVQRVQEYMQKAIREAKLHTSWVNPNAAYEEGMKRFVERALVGAGAAEFLASFVPFARRVARFGAVNSLAQLVLKIASPGVPDFYQGTEVWNLTLVDPDNRRALDFAAARRRLDELDPLMAAIDRGQADRAGEAPAGRIAELLAGWPDGRVKLLVTALGLRLRRSHADLFARGQYIPMIAEGWRGDHVVAFARRHESDLVVAIVPRLSATLSGLDPRWPMGEDVWKDTRLRLPDEYRRHTFRHVVTGERLPPLVAAEAAWLTAAHVLGSFPVGLLVAERP
jgi:(1->4)-alpha-D-glucan 1-alpha-D-glucosylmutase